MLNMQNVKDIEIPEGDVRTIHDKDNRLIWGRLAYDTKYAGDTYQQTYSGANIYNFRDTAAVSSQGVSVDDDGWITFTGDNTGGSSTLFVNYFSSPLQVVASTSYNVMLEIKGVNGTSGATLHLTSYHSVSQFREDSEITLSEIQPGITKYILTTASNISSCTVGLRTYLSCSAGNSGTVTFRLSVLKDTSITPEDFVYQPYTGGIPAPNPDYPQPIQVVTGEQTVTVSDGVDSEDFTISLGSNEFCSIGNYQDYIYNSGDDWYVHKETNKLIANSSQNWSYNEGTSPSNTRFGCDVSDAALEEYTASQPSIVMSNCFRGTNWYNLYRSLAGDNVVSLKENAHRIYVHMDSLTTIDAWNTFITNNTVLFRYVIATPTDTKITDATLVGQLNAVHEWLTRYGYNATVTGNLPIIISKTNL